MIIRKTQHLFPMSLFVELSYSGRRRDSFVLWEIISRDDFERLKHQNPDILIGEDRSGYELVFVSFNDLFKNVVSDENDIRVLRKYVKETTLLAKHLKSNTEERQDWNYVKWVSSGKPVAPMQFHTNV
jgi:hypothetical protein